jgi:hypothetical protein
MAQNPNKVNIYYAIGQVMENILSHCALIFCQTYDECFKVFSSVFLALELASCNIPKFPY